MTQVSKTEDSEETQTRKKTSEAIMIIRGMPGRRAAAAGGDVSASEPLARHCGGRAAA